MIETILEFEPAIRLTAFLGILGAMALWEIAAPRRRRDIPRVIRWTNNLALVVIDTAILRLTFPILAVGLAVLAEERGWGCCHVNLSAIGEGIALVGSSDVRSRFPDIKCLQPMEADG